MFVWVVGTRPNCILPCSIPIRFGRNQFEIGPAENSQFHALDEKNIKSIARIQLQYLEKRLAQMEMKLDISDAALKEIANAGFDPVYGARPLKRAIQSQLENPLAKLILEGRFAAKDTIKVDCKGGAMKFDKG